MKELIKRLQEQVGLSPEMAQQTVHVLFDFAKEKLPYGWGEKLEDLLNNSFESGKLLNGNSNQNYSVKDNPLDKLKSMFSK